MKFPQLREFRPFSVDSTDPLKLATALAKYLSIDLVRTFKDLMVGLRRLSFGDNFDAFVQTVTMPASSELAIRNTLPSGLIPTSKIILRGGSGAQLIVDGTTEWDENFVYLENLGGTAVEIKVVFLR